MSQTELVGKLARDAAARCFIGLLVALCACANPAHNQPENLPSGLIVLPEATRVRSTKQNAGSVIYEVQEPYPATRVIRELTETLRREGWTALDHDVLNPGMSTSIGEWADFEDRTKPKPGRVYQWLGQWEGPNGTIAVYMLRYQADDSSRSARSAPVMPLIVSGTLLSAEAVQRMRQAVPK